MRILALDTAANLCAACIVADGRERARAVRDVGTGHAEILLDLAGETLDASGFGWRDLDAIAVSVGPGSFTGVRIGVAAARGLSLALAIPSVGISTLDALDAEARETYPDRPVLSAIDAGRGEIYAALRDGGGALLAGPAIMTLAEAAALLTGETVACGSGAEPIAAEAGISPAIAGRGRTADIAVYARLADRRDGATSPARPLYLRGSGAAPQSGFALPRRAG